jgi:hypothetical protein
MIEALSSSETSVFTRSLLRNIPEDAILQEINIFVYLIIRADFMYFLPASGGFWFRQEMAFAGHFRTKEMAK